MRLTIFTDYALRTLIYLGVHHHEESLTTINDIAIVYGISQNHLMKVVHRLAKQGYVNTTRGKDGGMRLAREPAQINIGDVVRGVEDDLALVECFQEGNLNCPIIPVCQLQEVLSRAMSAFFEVLDSATLADLITPKENLKSIFDRMSKQH